MPDLHRGRSPRPVLVAVLGLAGAALVVGAFWNYSIRPRMDALDLPGEYRVDVFLHVQYVAEGGQGRILNRNTTSLTLKR